MARKGSNPTFVSYIDGDEVIGDLISFDDSDAGPDKPANAATELAEAEGASPGRSESEGGGAVNMDQQQQSCKQSERLCGYLSKLGAKGLVKTFKRRWFVYVENSCKLVYYRTPQDLLSLGEIDISQASFSFKAENDEKPGAFEISSCGRIYYLDAGDRNTMLYWLQSLQRKRRDFSRKQTILSREQVHASLSIQQPKEGLLRRNTSSGPASVNEPETAFSSEVLDELEDRCQPLPQQNNKLGLTNFSFSNLKTELRNALAGIRQQRSTEILDFEPPDSSSPVSKEVFTLENGDTSSKKITKEAGIANAPLMRSNTFSVADSPGQRGMEGKPSKKFALSKRLKIKSTSLDVSTAGLPEPKPCTKCNQFQTYITSLKDDIRAVEEELEAHREIVRLLQRQIDVQQREKLTEQAFQNASEDRQMLELLQQKDKTIVDLEHLLGGTQEEKELVRSQARALEAEIQSNKEQMALLRESLTAKDEVVLSLTERISEMEQQGIPSDTNTDHHNVSIYCDARELERYKDMCVAYKLQNQFLNNEILELSDLRKNDQAREKSLQISLAEMEAKYYRIQSKYMLCLKELEKPQRGSGDDTGGHELVSRLLQEALEGGMTLQNQDEDIAELRSFSPMEHDKYGFYLIQKGSEEDLLAKANRFQRRSHELVNQVKDYDKNMSIVVKWENYLLTLGDRDLPVTRELKELIRQGIPHQHKEKIWRGCINLRLGNRRLCTTATYYEKLVDKESGSSVNPAAKQIELDLLRTLPNNKHYERIDSEGVQKLRRVLLAYSRHNSTIGYCQGLNRLVAIALLFLKEQDAFWCLVAIVEVLMPDHYFTQSMIASHADQRVLRDLIQEKLPRLHAHLDQHDVDLSLFTFNWFLTIFVDNIPVETYLRVWDTFLYEGDKVLFRYALAFLKYREDELLQQEDSMAIHKYLRTIGENITDVRRVTEIAFVELNPFPKRTIRQKRQLHLAQVQAELNELNIIRSEYKSQRPQEESDEESFELLSDTEPY